MCDADLRASLLRASAQALASPENRIPLLVDPINIPQVFAISEDFKMITLNFPQMAQTDTGASILYGTIGDPEFNPSPWI